MVGVADRDQIVRLGIAALVLSVLADVAILTVHGSTTQEPLLVQLGYRDNPSGWAAFALHTGWWSVLTAAGLLARRPWLFFLPALALSSELHLLDANFETFGELGLYLIQYDLFTLHPLRFAAHFVPYLVAALCPWAISVSLALRTFRLFRGWTQDTFQRSQSRESAV